MDASAAEEMTNSMLMDSPVPDTEEEKRRPQEEIPIGKPIVPSPPNLDFLLMFSFLLRDCFLGPLNQEDSVEKVAEAPHVEASLVAGTKTSVAPLGSARH